MRQFFLALILLFFCGKVCDAAIVLRMDPVESKMMFKAHILGVEIPGHVECRAFTHKYRPLSLKDQGKLMGKLIPL